MLRKVCLAVLVSLPSLLIAQAAPRPSFDAFEVATVKQADPEMNNGRYFRMESPTRFIARGFTLKFLVAAAYDLNPKEISGGPAWMESERFDINAVTPGDVRPSRDEQMRMLRKLLVERFGLTFHRVDKEFSLYEIDAAKGGQKLKPTTAKADDPSNVVCTVYPQRILLPARNVTIDEVARMMQRALFDRPVVDKTGITGRYDFDLAWAPDETQLGGDIPPSATPVTDPPIFIAMQEQLGLTLKPTRGLVSTLVVDRLQKPTAD